MGFLWENKRPLLNHLLLKHLVCLCTHCNCLSVWVWARVCRLSGGHTPTHPRWVWHYCRSLLHQVTCHPAPGCTAKAPFFLVVILIYRAGSSSFCQLEEALFFVFVLQSEAKRRAKASKWEAQTKPRCRSSFLCFQTFKLNSMLFSIVNCGCLWLPLSPLPYWKHIRHCMATTCGMHWKL